LTQYSPLFASGLHPARTEIHGATAGLARPLTPEDPDGDNW